MKRNRRKQPKLYLFREDIKELNDEYSILYQNIRNDQNLSTEQIARACEVLLEKYNFEIEELSNFREAEYWKKQAEIEAKNAEQIPWRRGWWWKLIFQPTTNRAQDIIEEQAALEAEALFAPIEKKLDNRAKTLYAGTGKKLSRRKRQWLMKKYLKLRDKLIGDESKADNAAPDEKPQSLEISSEAPPDADSVQIQYANHSIAGVSFVPRTANNADSQNNAEPPAPPARKPRKTDNKPPQPMAQLIDPPAEVAQHVDQ